MSLRVDDRKSSGRSRSEKDSRDERSVSPPKVKAAKSKKKARFGDDDDDAPEKAVPGAWEDEPGPDAKYELRQPRLLARDVASGRSSRRTDDDSNESDDEWERRRSRRSSRPYEDEEPTSPGGTAIQMPSFPGLSSLPSLPGFGSKNRNPKPPSKSRQQAAVYPDMTYPTEDGGAFAMPSADLDALAYGQSYEPRSRRRRSPSASPESRPQPRHADSWSTREDPRAPPPLPRSNSMPYQAEVREPRSKGLSALSTLDEKEDELKKRGHRLSINEPRTELRTPSIGGLQPRMNSLSVSGLPSHSGSGLPPPSPLLEAYKGTYQSISPMPSPSLLAHDRHGSLDDIEPLTPLDESNKRLSFRPGSKDSDTPTSSTLKPKRRVVIYDAPTDAAEIWKALDHFRHIDTEPLIRILPGLTHDQLLELRETYRKTYKKGGEKVDMAKHIKLQTEGNFGKIAFVTASGRWKSEAYWASVWYQSHAAGRELLIESLMGRSNAEVREIKKAFRDRRYEDNLARCMRKELKPDKFRDAVLAVLEEQRQEETDALPVQVREGDVETLRRAMTSPSGGESAILAIVVGRSDKHLADVLRSYQAAYRSRFAEDALKKSGNLVGEVIAHILNGVINRPARDSQLLHHAIEDISAKNKAVDLRYELLISRLVRLHWDRMHLAKVKQYYKEKYKVTLEHDIESATIAGGDFGRFCLGLCET